MLQKRLRNRGNHFFTQDFERPTACAISWWLQSACSNHTSLNLLRLTIHSSSIATFLAYPQHTPTAGVGHDVGKFSWVMM